MDALKSPPGDDPIIMEALFRAPISRVWRAWTEPERVRQWFGREPGSLIAAEMDVRVGGHWSYVMREDAAGRERLTGAYTDVTPETRLAFTWRHVDEPAGGEPQETPVSPGHRGAVVRRGGHAPQPPPRRHPPRRRAPRRGFWVDAVSRCHRRAGRRAVTGRNLSARSALRERVALARDARCRAALTPSRTRKRPTWRGSGRRSTRRGSASRPGNRLSRAA